MKDSSNYTSRENRTLEAEDDFDINIINTDSNVWESAYPVLRLPTVSSTASEYIAILTRVQLLEKQMKLAMTQRYLVNNHKIETPCDDDITKDDNQMTVDSVKTDITANTGSDHGVLIDNAAATSAAAAMTVLSTDSYECDAQYQQYSQRCYNLFHTLYSEELQQQQQQRQQQHGWDNNIEQEEEKDDHNDDDCKPLLLQDHQLSPGHYGYVNTDVKFAACGDYLAAASPGINNNYNIECGSSNHIESAVLSAMNVAERIYYIDSNNNNERPLNNGNTDANNQHRRYPHKNHQSAAVDLPGC